MIELKDNQLIISFPEVHPDAKACIDFKEPCVCPMMTATTDCLRDGII